MTKSPAFQFYPNDWLSSPKIATMTPAEEGAYIRLLCYDWANDGIPDNDQQLAALSRLGEGWLKGGCPLVRQCFNQHPTKPGHLTNQRLQKERQKQSEWHEKSRSGGLQSGRIRKLTTETKGGSTTLEPKGNSSSSSSSSSSDSTTPTPSPVERELDDHLKTSRMVLRWRQWQTVRRGLKKPKNWLDLFNEQCEWLGQHTEPVAFEILSASIRNGWTGLFEVKSNQWKGGSGSGKSSGNF